ncbi:MAG: cytochrome oxidase putative small subunit CydP [Neisseriaceae bacterium]
MKKIDKYWKHILLVLIVKSILLTGMWYVFFSDTPKLNDYITEKHIFSND